MKVTKIGHCCLLIEHEGKRILTDPGAFTRGQEDVADIDIVLITHEHADHLHVDSLKTVMGNNPDAIIVTNESVGNILEDNGISFTAITDGEKETVNNILLEAFGTKHAEIYRDYGQVENTGYLIANKLFYPGDAFTDPDKSVDILALPVEGPWMALKEAIDYALTIKPKSCFPVHDGRLQEDRIGSSHGVVKMALEKSDISFVALKEGDSHDFS